MKQLSQLKTQNYLKNFELRKERFDKKVEGKKVEHEFQEICLEMVEWFKPRYDSMVWQMPYRNINWTDNKAQRALDICKQKNVKSIPYFCGILKNL